MCLWVKYLLLPIATMKSAIYIYAFGEKAAAKAQQLHLELSWWLF